ncbi:GtrA family protein [Rhizobiaceae bacterium n13]|uniref:GtrA family protein n=1 Tax=Ferirhizobium litorale TaxID=2927786 RepID=A0AAE3U4I0_9HYPH|nr:GtrA family protein [Fererhizobium litorale]MDI7864547.1 GtrA family protein [Fererhizobium litorale]MDI7924912.1 GtrA family protein [Fererhizobium litorale]
MRRIVSFVLAGGCGFAVDAAVLSLLVAFTPFGPFAARAIAIAVAMAATWGLNRTFTFGRSGRTLADEGVRYGSVGLLSALLNYALYAALLLSIPQLRPLPALAMASLAAMAFSFFGYARFVFRRS